MKRIWLSAIFISLCVTSCAPEQQAIQPSQPQSADNVALDRKLPVDSDVTIGTLENGVTYYIRHNTRPESRLDLRLVIKAGSVEENDDQRGLAHFTEHMAFNGTAHFEKNELVDYLESIGMRFGPDLNAYTSFDETVYMLQVPTDSTLYVEQAFRILSDWADSISFTQEELDKERGVIEEEWRLRRGADARITDLQLPVLFKGSKYAERLPIGEMDIVRNAPRPVFVRFYQDWYRPDLQAVIVVGDFDPAETEKLIRAHFSSLPRHPEAPPLERYPVPGNEEPLFSIVTDPEATGSEVGIYYKHDVRDETTFGDYRRMLVESLFTSMFNQRLRELTRLADPPIISGQTGRSRFVRSKEFYYLDAQVRDDRIAQGFETLLTEATRVRQHGFTQSELDRQKNAMLRYIEQAYNERDKTESQSYTAEYTRNFLEDEPIPGIKAEYDMYRSFIPGIALSEVNSLIDQWITDDNQVVMISAPEKESVTVPSEADLTAIMERIAGIEVAAYVDTLSRQPLVETPPEPSRVVSEHTIDEIGVTEWELTNGVRVILKPTTFKNDEILFTAFSPGGSSLVSLDQYVPAATATAVVSEGGVGAFSRTDLEKLLSDKVVSVSPSISTLEEGMSGGAAPEDIEIMFQLIYLYFTQPRRDPQAFQSLVSRLETYIVNRSADPGTAYNDTLSVTLADYNPRVRPWTMSMLDEMNLDASLAIYRDRFSDAGDFTFVFVGNFEADSLRPLVETWLGGLPSTGREESWRDLGIEPPDGVVSKRVIKGLEQVSDTSIVFPGDFEWNRLNRYRLVSMVDVLNITLRETLREDLGGTYSVSVSPSYAEYPREEYEISVSFGSAPDRVDELVTAVFAQIDSLKQYGPAHLNLSKVKETQRRERETSLRENSFWLSNLEFYYYHEEDPREVIRLEPLIEALTADDIRRAAERYFDEDHYIQVTLYPEAFTED